MTIKVKIMQPGDESSWDAYVQTHPNAAPYHLSGWKKVIEKTYGHKSYYLMALKNSLHLSAMRRVDEQFDQKAHCPEFIEGLTSSRSKLDFDRNPIVGILPLFHLKHFLFGNSLVSIPFFDMAGILANDEEAERALISEAIKIGKRLGVDQIELRQPTPLSCFTGKPPMSSVNSINPTNPINPSNPINSSNPINPSNSSNPTNPMNPINISMKSKKTRMLLSLPDSPETLLKSFKSKLRSQIKRPIKEGLCAKAGGIELLEDFYKVFLINMRELGSPVHSKKIMKYVLEVFVEQSKIIIVYNKSEPLACSLICAYKNTLQNPWSSALRQHSTVSANMFLYWKMLEYACEKGLKYFDFGRSTPEEGTYKFKEQWGAKPIPLYWYYISLNDSTEHKPGSEKEKFEKAINYWKKLPLPITRILGPMIRKHIAL